MNPTIFSMRDEELTAACYWLAAIYGQDPDVFLSKPAENVARHVHWTIRVQSAETFEAGEPQPGN
jgi:hypothetical protein